MGVFLESFLKLLLGLLHFFLAQQRDPDVIISVISAIRSPLQTGFEKALGVFKLLPGVVRLAQ